MGLSRKMKIALWTVGVFTFITAGLSASIAWFNSGTNSFEADVSGSVVEEYFHTGDGTSANPYVITRPIHYYHLVEFFQRETALDEGARDSRFGSDYLYFQVGYDFDGTGVRKVYNYNDLGIYQGTAESPSYSTTLNMAYYSGENALLPIGTNEVPFIGSFDGGKTSSGGITIANLSIHCSEDVIIDDAVVSRSASDIGVFGYVADSVSSTRTVIQNAFFDNLTIDLSDVASETAASSTTVSHTSTHDSNQAYVGYIAGHIHTYSNKTNSANASPLTNVFVNNATVRGGAGVSSNFGYIGKVDTNDGVASGTVEGEVSELYEEGPGSDWGGSISMRDLAGRVESVYSLTGNGAITNETPSFDFSKTYQISPDGQTRTLTGSSTKGQNNYGYYYTHSSTAKAGQFRLAASEATNGNVLGTNRTIYGLAGGHYEINEQLSYVLYTSYKIHDGAGHYLNYQSTNNFNTTEANAPQWIIPTFEEGNNYVSGYIHTTVGNTTYYLTKNDSDSLAVVQTQNSAKTWELSKSSSTIRVECQGFSLRYSSGWSLVRSEPEGSYAISSGSNKLTMYYQYPANATSFNNSYFKFNTSFTPKSGYITGSTTGWMIEPTTSVTKTTFAAAAADKSQTYAVYAIANNTFKAYLSIGTGLGVTAGKTYNQQKLTISLSGNEYSLKSASNRYLAYSSTWYTVTSSRSVSVSESVSYTLPWDDDDLTIITSDTETYVSSRDMNWRYDTGEVGYLPLNVTADGSISNAGELSNYAAMDINTGYLVGGDYTEISSVGRYQNYHPCSVLISHENKSIFLENYQGKVRTIDKAGDDDEIGSTNDFSKYDATKTKLDDEYLSGNRVYGVHFVGNTVSADHIFTATNIVFNRSDSNTSTFATYEMPVGCFDFSLKKKGLMNFYAATFQNSSEGGAASDSTNAFFSLHKIIRNAQTNEIVDLLEIKQIYANPSFSGYSYVYKFGNGKYSKPYRFVGGTKVALDGSAYIESNGESECATGYELVFDCDKQLLHNNTLAKHTLYYFEVPMSDGEYALGSVTDSTGACLLYLDISANASSTGETTPGIKSAPLFTQIGFTSGTYMTNSVFNVAYTVPNGSDSSKFSITISVESGVVYNQKTYTCFNLVITNTAGPLSLSSLLMDDDDNPVNEYLYMYSITYNGGTKKYFTLSDTFTGDANGNSMTPEHSTN